MIFKPYLACPWLYRQGSNIVLLKLAEFYVAYKLLIHGDRSMYKYVSILIILRDIKTETHIYW